MIIDVFEKPIWFSPVCTQTKWVTANARELTHELAHEELNKTLFYKLPTEIYDLIPDKIKSDFEANNRQLHDCEAALILLDVYQKLYQNTLTSATHKKEQLK